MGRSRSPLTVQDSYRYCHALTRRTAANFYPAFLLLPRVQRRAMEALYAYSRLTDDLADDPGDPAIKANELRAWRAELSRALAGDATHPIHLALRETVARFDVPQECLFDVIDGVEMDLNPVPMETFADLREYCRRVASSVGLACIHVWGFDGHEATTAAIDAGIAFQLTNILRDLAEDRAAGRIYLPAEDLARFDSMASEWRADCPRFRALMQFQVERARCFYARGSRLRSALSPAGRAVFSALVGTYEGLLNEIEARNYDVFRERVRLGKRRKAAELLGALPVKWGWRD